MNTKIPNFIEAGAGHWPKRTQADYIANVNEVQRLRGQLEQTQRELSNARVARDQAICERDYWKNKCEEDERQLRQEIDRLKLRATDWDHGDPEDCPKCPAARAKGIACECGRPRAWTETPAHERCEVCLPGDLEITCCRKKGHTGAHAFE